MSAGLNKHVGEQFSKKLINVQVLNKSFQVEIFQKINKICCTIITDIRVNLIDEASQSVQRHS